MSKIDRSRTFYFVVLGVAILILIALGVWIGQSWSGDKEKLSSYSAVYLTSGDIYFGELSWFPWPRIKTPWYLERSVNSATQAQEVNLLPLSSVFWGPGGDLRLNPKEIIFTTRLRSDSQVIAIMKGENQAPPSVSQVPQESSEDTTSTESE